MDIETTNIEHGDAREAANSMVCVAWQTGRGDTPDGPAKCYYGRWQDCAECLQAMEQADYCIAWHCKFEAHWFFREGFDPTNHLWADPMLAEWVRYANNPQRLSFSMENTAPRYGELGKEKLINNLMKGGVCPSWMPRGPLMERCKRDVEVTARVWHKQVAFLAEREQLHLVAQRCLLAPVLASIERQGILLDDERVLQKHATFSAQLAELREQWNSLTGGINMRSANELVPFLFNIWPQVKEGKDYRPMTAEEKKATGIKPLGFKLPARAKMGKATNTWPEGRPPTNKLVMLKLADATRNKRQKRWVALRKEIGHVADALSKSLDFYKGTVDEYDSIFYADLMQGITATHRLSGRGRPRWFHQFQKVKTAQGQNQPREFKSLQKAHEGMLAWNADGKQLEFRFAVQLSQDKQGMQDLLHPDFDAHLQTLTIMLHGPLQGDKYTDPNYVDLLARYRAGDKEVKLQRADNQLCKGHTFKPLFGGEFGSDRETAYYSWFREHYADMTNTCMDWLQEVEVHGTLHAPSGLVFEFDVTCRKGGVFFNRATNKPIKPVAFNYPIQNVSGEAMEIAVICLHYRIKKQRLNAKITNSVHDSASGEVAPEHAVPLRQNAFAAFTSDVVWWLDKAYKLKVNVPLGCDFEIGSHVGEGDSFSFDQQETMQ